MLSMINRLQPTAHESRAGVPWWRRTRAAFAVSCLAVIGACSQQHKPPDNTPAGIVSQFYTWRIQSHMTGAPTTDELAGMRPLISNELQTLLTRISVKAAGANEDKNDANASGKKHPPAFTDGDLFSSIATGPTSFTIGEAEIFDNDVRVIPVRFMSARQLPAINWTDRVKVINENGRYVLADIEYANHWQAGGTGTLVKSLRQTANKTAKS